MQSSSKHSIIGESPPQLTIANVKYWYWEVDPHWSAIDIAGVVGCKDSEVYYFMQRNNIPRRSTTEANLNRFNCPHKYESYIRQRSSPGFRKLQSIKSIEAWQDPKNRAKIIKGIQEGVSKKISVFQKLLLFLLIKHDFLFLTDFIQLTNLSRKSLDLVLSSLYKRELVKRAKEHNPNTHNNYKYHFRYEITERGKELLMLDMTTTPFCYEELLTSIQARYVRNGQHPPKKKTPSNYINIGKNQLILLQIFQEQDQPLFLLDVIKYTTISQKAIDNSLTHLYRRGYLSRKKTENSNYAGNIQHAKQFLYKLTEEGKKLIEIKLG